MIIYLLAMALDFILGLVINIIPAIGVPAFMVSSIGEAISIVAKFNLYLPISELFSVVGFITVFFIQWKITVIVLNKVGIDLNK